MPRCLVIGADSTLGRSLARRLAGEGWETHGTTRRRDTVGPTRLYLDLTAPETWRNLPKAEIVWLMAGATRQIECRRDVAGTWRINVDHTLALARLLAGQGARIVFPSTNLVFDGTRPNPRPLDAPSPVGDYARQKAAVEQGLLNLSQASAVILRPGKVLSPHLPLIQNWTDALGRGQPITPFADLFIAPIDLELAIDLLVKLGVSAANGVFHFCSRDQINYADVAHRLVERLGLDPGLLRPRAMPDDLRQAGAPAAYATLDCASTEALLGLRAPWAREVVDKVIGQG
jgi:dTDP-4-dehydrorhamnose reductase